MSKIACVIALSLGLSATARAQSRPWVDLARSDLEAVHVAILDNHPGPVDPLNPGYRRWLDEGYRRALQKADSVRGLDGLMAVLSWYTSGFEDGHLGWNPTFERRFVAWPGFVVSLRGGRFLIDHVADWAGGDGPRTGDEVLACDGEPLDRLLVDQVMAYEEGIPSLEASRVRLAPHLFVYDGNPWRSRFESCRVRGPEGERTVELSWRWLGRDALEPLLERAAYGEGPKDFAITHPADGVAWVTIPSFAENRDDNRAGLEQLVDSMPALRGEDLIVFDVRGNRGGNSWWGARLAEALFGEEYVGRVESALDQGVRIDWRASEGNADFIENNTLPRFEPGSDTHEYLQNVVEAMRAGLEGGDPLVSLTNDTSTRSPLEIEPVPLGERVILLTDGWCASACLDFADVLLAIPGVRHLGAATYADAVYIDNRGIVLPSGLGQLGFSMKVYRNRPRGNNEPYVPDVPYPGDRWDTAALQAWVLDTLR